MLTKNLTPFLFGVKVTSRKPPQREMTMVVRGTFTLAHGAPMQAVEGLDQGFLTGDVFRDDDDERLGECLYPNDFADYKLNAEVLLLGTCHAPGQRQVVECPVRFAVGSWSKILRVVGPRVWSDNLSGAVMSEPLPFTRMPLDHAHAYGGPTFAWNPSGKGHDGRELPNVEHPAQPIRSRNDRPEPAGFGPLNPLWPQRASKMGKEYGKSYQEKRAPFYAEDFDWTYFSAAPLDQQLKGYLRGDEELSVHNVHPHAPVIVARLPGLRVRAFVNDVVGAFREVALSLDTLTVDADKGVVYLTWRGLDKVREDDLTDVKTVLIASEPLADHPLPEAHYRQILDAFEKDPTGLLASMPPDFIAAAAGAGQAGQAPPPGVDPLTATIEQKFGKTLTAEQSPLGQAADVLKRPEVASRLDMKAALAKAANDDANRAPAFLSLKPGSLGNLGLRDTMRGVMAKVAELKKAAAASNREVKNIAELEALPHDPRLKQLDPSYTPPGPISTDEPGPYRNLSEQDLSGRDLSGLDLRGATMEGTNLTGAKLRGTKLTGAILRNAVLYKADLTDAYLTDADLTLANCGAVHAIGASFRGATLEQAFFQGANLTFATLTEVKGEYVAFGGADLTEVKAHRARLDHSDFSEASLQQADFSSASLALCLFTACRAARVNLSGALLNGANFAGADLRGGRFNQARGDRSFWTKALLDGADFGHAVLLAAHFTECSAVSARFYGANLRECRFYRATLERAEIVRANLFSADLCKAKLDGARFTGSSLYDAKFLQASGAGCDFTDANLKRSTLERS
ncbi:DUF2169 family type VI secretion system accessory protein [Chondromyces apiculatus]|uniref:DUF2169 domain-containing protein n=1 Tax=Chondromyces apiculatus DSM 436 TaxID=1192034 RepID=A0A017THZ4_9BACT|nr:DUF2169 domain-containing protein [Chondromyces apiculatus]EYF08874.1 Hypothetical protein CAP_2735 [Chondromyces apiculatus DSM 436]